MSQWSKTTPGYFLLGLHVCHTSAGLRDNEQSPRLRGQLRAQALPVAVQRESLCSVPCQCSKCVPCSYPQFTGQNSPLPAKKMEPQACPPQGEGKLEHWARSTEGFHGGVAGSGGGQPSAQSCSPFYDKSPTGVASNPAEKLPSQPPPLLGVASDSRNDECKWMRQTKLLQEWLRRTDPAGTSSLPSCLKRTQCSRCNGHAKNTRWQRG